MELDRFDGMGAEGQGRILAKTDGVLSRRIGIANGRQVRTGALDKTNRPEKVEAKALPDQIFD